MNAIVDKKKVPEKLLGNLNETSVNSSHELLNKNLNKDGYLFLKNVVASKEVELARNQVFKKLHEINEIKEPYNEGIFSGKSDRDVLYWDRGGFWKSVSDLDSVMRGIHNSLDNDGVGAIEFHDATEIYRGLQYDSIYHEHLCYFSLNSFNFLIQKYNLFSFDVITSPINAGNKLVFFF